ncbi:unnamed protein product [Caenorhabditis bovis]|uniref:PHD-type domain-containing protein n=1 Tax=Caenorhabditis bovis TaxID=2654633 RepID=A0A8S1EHT5_9PELO|nr:unnamed protein product [Caenorhabditis bovis]
MQALILLKESATCPLCRQTYERLVTVFRLKNGIKIGSEEWPSPNLNMISRIRDFLTFACAKCFRLYGMNYKNDLRCNDCGYWFHKKCIAKEEYTSSNVFRCSPCMALRKQNVCRKCLKITEKDEETLLSCQKCGKRRHIDCISLPFETLMPHYICKSCKNSDLIDTSDPSFEIENYVEEDDLRYEIEHSIKSQHAMAQPPSSPENNNPRSPFNENVTNSTPSVNVVHHDDHIISEKEQEKRIKMTEKIATAMKNRNKSKKPPPDFTVLDNIRGPSFLMFPVTGIPTVAHAKIYRLGLYTHKSVLDRDKKLGEIETKKLINDHYVCLAKAKARREQEERRNYERLGNVIFDKPENALFSIREIEKIADDFFSFKFKIG